MERLQISRHNCLSILDGIREKKTIDKNYKNVERFSKKQPKIVKANENSRIFSKNSKD